MTKIKNDEIQKMKKKQWNQEQLARSDQIYLSKELKDELTSLLNELLKRTGLKSKHVFDLFPLLCWHLSKTDPKNHSTLNGKKLFNFFKTTYPEVLNHFEKSELIFGNVSIKRLTLHKDIYAIYSLIEDDFKECLKQLNDRRYRTFEVPDYIFTCVKNYIQEGKISDEEVKEFFNFTEKNLLKKIVE